MSTNSSEKIAVVTSNRHLAKNAVWNFVGLGAPLLVAVFAIPLLIKGLGVDRFGILTLAWMAIGYFNLFDLGLGRALTKLVAEKLGAGDNRDISALIWTSLILMALLGLVGTVVIAGLSSSVVYGMLKIPVHLQEESLSVFYLLGVAIPIVITTAGLRGVLEAHQRFDLTNAVRIPMGLFNFLGPVAILPFSHNLIPVVAVLVAGRIIVWGVYFIQCLRVVPALHSGILVQRDMILPLFRFGGWMTVSNIISPLMVYLDRFLIGALLSVTAVAYYTTPWEVVTKLFIVSSAVTGVLFPAFSSSFAQDPSRSIQLYKKGIKYVFIILFPIILFIVVFARDILQLWLGNDFADNSHRPMQLLAIGVLINCLASIPFAFIQGRGRADLTAKLHLLEVLIYLPGAYWLISHYGIVGASLAWVLRVSIDALLLFIVVERKAYQKSTSLLKYVPAFLSTLIILTIAIFLMKLPLKITYATVVLTVFLFLSWQLLFDNDDRSFLSHKVKLFFRNK